MIKMGTRCWCVDNSGVILVKVFQVFGNKERRVATFGDKVFVNVRGVNRHVKKRWDDKKKYRFRKGSVHIAVVVHLNKLRSRRDRTCLWFPWNAVVLITKTHHPVARRIKSAIPREVALRYPALASIADKVI